MVVNFNNFEMTRNDLSFVGNWGPGPSCTETGEEMEFRFGVDAFQFCGWSIDSNDTYRHFAAMIDREEDWRCRIAMAPNFDFYLPFNIPIWGVVEADHIHVDNHFNFVFHADEGKIIGVTAYPVRDNFQFGKPGSVISIHGPVKWFRRGTFFSYSSNMFMEMYHLRIPILFLWTILVCLVTFITGVITYKFYLRPTIVRSLMAQKKTKPQASAQ
eukprot:TRINITY_DN2938_c0_g1_i1.p1 TRINITY_DN2938_c0_g1~~TRINITY_DN2938_c0_g1_i1.p1  ORF type:complete len:214 (+),score=13.25 TRINITY_DN2938_c0_g1_i1:143-784(+)